MHALLAAEHFTADAQVRHRTFADDGARDRYGALGVVGGLGDAPLVFRIADVSGNDRSWRSLEPVDAVRIPPGDVRRRERFSLLTDGIPDGNAFETTGDAVAGFTIM